MISRFKTVHKSPTAQRSASDPIVSLRLAVCLDTQRSCQSIKCSQLALKRRHYKHRPTCFNLEFLESPHKRTFSRCRDEAFRKDSSVEVWRSDGCRSTQILVGIAHSLKINFGRVKRTKLSPTRSITLDLRSAIYFDPMLTLYHLSTGDIYHSLST